MKKSNLVKSLIAIASASPVAFIVSCSLFGQSENSKNDNSSSNIINKPKQDSQIQKDGKNEENSNNATRQEDTKNTSSNSQNENQNQNESTTKDSNNPEINNHTNDQDSVNNQIAENNTNDQDSANNQETERNTSEQNSENKQKEVNPSQDDQVNESVNNSETPEVVTEEKQNETVSENTENVDHQNTNSDVKEKENQDSSVAEHDTSNEQENQNAETPSEEVEANTQETHPDSSNVYQNLLNQVEKISREDMSRFFANIYNSNVLDDVLEGINNQEISLDDARIDEINSDLYAKLIELSNAESSSNYSLSRKRFERLSIKIVEILLKKILPNYDEVLEMLVFNRLTSNGAYFDFKIESYDNPGKQVLKFWAQNNWTYWDDMKNEVINRLVSFSNDLSAYYKAIKNSISIFESKRDQTYTPSSQNIIQEFKSASELDILKKYSFKQLDEMVTRIKGDELRQEAHKLVNYKPSRIIAKFDEILNNSVNSSSAKEMIESVSDEFKTYLLEEFKKVLIRFEATDHLYKQIEIRLKYIIKKIESDFGNPVVFQWGYDDNKQLSLEPTIFKMQSVQVIEFNALNLFALLGQYLEYAELLNTNAPNFSINTDDLDIYRVVDKYTDQNSKDLLKTNLDLHPKTWYGLKRVNTQEEYINDYLTMDLNGYESFDVIEDPIENDVVNDTTYEKRQFMRNYAEFTDKYFLKLGNFDGTDFELQEEQPFDNVFVRSHDFFKNVDYKKFRDYYGEWQKYENGDLHFERTDDNWFFAQLLSDKPGYFYDYHLNPTWLYKLPDADLNNLETSVYKQLNNYEGYLKPMTYNKTIEITKPVYGSVDHLDKRRDLKEQSVLPKLLINEWIAKWKEVLPKIVDKNWSDEKKVKAVALFIASNTMYMKDELDGDQIDFTLEGYGFYSPFQIFKNDIRQKCVGYTSNVSMALTLLGIPVRQVGGLLTQPGVSDDGGHAWNEVYLDGRWKIVDLTNIDAAEQDSFYLEEGYDPKTAQTSRLLMEIDLDLVLQERNAVDYLKLDLSNYLMTLFKYKNPQGYNYQGMPEYFTKTPEQQPTWQQWTEVRNKSRTS
ncbi:transglutaminase-like domain-containing protein [Mycoplasma sp. Ms02]|uniref:transglutaminase-like domain-containing protein n=1 Tax=Mycoplasma sp. Ms02 TaxID=353851 RepID=UPI001C88EACD|nr:transglutaminase-like domain-containing protein [Mycoplasma sp. Ms02]QZE12260.1 hypothetical protein K4L35_02915 [Mycoplasma sp. Ms02]